MASEFRVDERHDLEQLKERGEVLDYVIRDSVSRVLRSMAQATNVDLFSGRLTVAIEWRRGPVNGRPCGCDPGLDHVCREHAAARDGSETTLRARDGQWNPVHLAIGGPDPDGELYVETQDRVAYLTRFDADELVEELQRRLKVR